MLEMKCKKCKQKLIVITKKKTKGGIIREVIDAEYYTLEPGVTAIGPLCRKCDRELFLKNS